MSSEGIGVGSVVRLTHDYMRYATHDVQKAFSGTLRVEAAQGGVFQLHNGAEAGLCRLTVTSPNWLVQA